MNDEIGMLYSDLGTSYDAAVSMEGVRESLREQIYQVILNEPMTCDQVEMELGLRHQTASARIRELVLMNRIEDSGAKGLTRSNREARIYVAKKGNNRQ